VTGSQFLFFEPYADGAPQTWQNTGTNFSAGIYTLTVDVGYATGFATDGGNATASFQLSAFNGLSYDNTIATPTTVSSTTLSGHYGSFSTYTFTMNLTGGETFIGQEDYERAMINRMKKEMLRI
jgi:hypothetical protein